MPYISQITLPSGSTYEIKDAWARTQIEALTGGSAIVFKGVSSTSLTDGGNENPTVDGQPVLVKATGELYFYDHQEFIYGDDNKWHLLGSELGLLGALAYEDSASGTFTPAGTVSQPTFTGGSNNVTITASTNASGNYTPTGTISGGVFSASSLTSTGSFTPSGTVSLSNANTTATVSTVSGTATYTPGGTVSTPTISVQTAGTTTTVKNPTAVTVAKTVTAMAPSASTHPANNITYYDVDG